MRGELDEIGMVRRMVVIESAGQGVEGALRVVSAGIGVGYWTAWGIYHGRRKDVPSRLIGKIRQAYWEFCRKQLSKFEAELLRVKARCGDDGLEDFEAAVLSLAAKLESFRRAD